MGNTEILIISSPKLEDFENELIETSKNFSIIEVDENKINGEFVARVTVQN
ncbi:MAG: hypothetical protein ACRC8M_13895 [Cetobacterium sp.]|uniref:hypothetical protein n=1 Tax=Cetobacterium sp. TaxID=2071632 RepID=UPI003F29F94C